MVVNRVLPPFHEFWEDMCWEHVILMSWHVNQNKAKKEKVVFTVTCLEKNGSVGQHFFFFFIFFFFATQTNEMHILAVIMLHQHKFGVYKEKKNAKIAYYLWKLCTFCPFTVFILLCKFFFRKCGKKSYSRGVLERVCRVTVNSTFFLFFSRKDIHSLNVIMFPLALNL